MMSPALSRRWFQAVVLVSIFLAVVTFASYATQGSGGLSRLLFLLGLGGENNVGAWWSSMLLLLAAVLAFDGFVVPESPEDGRRGWLALAAVLLVLSFDEVSSLHEYLANAGLPWIAAYAALVFALACYALVRLYRSGISAGRFAAILVGFGLFASVPLHEFVQQTGEWNAPWARGLRAFFEEGSEIAGMLLLVGATRANGAALLRSRADPLAAVARRRLSLALAAAAALPAAVAATFVLPFPGGPADWLASSLYFACALLVARRAASVDAPDTARAAGSFVWYLAASAGSTAVSLEWNPSILGTPIGLRGLFVTLLLLSAPFMLRWNGREAGRLAFCAAALAALVASYSWPESQMLWCSVPPAVALWVYTIESKGSIAERAPAAVAVAEPDVG